MYQVEYFNFVVLNLHKVEYGNSQAIEVINHISSHFRDMVECTSSRLRFNTVNTV